MKKIKTSPIDNQPLDSFISCKDFTVSHETFSIFIDKESELLITTPRPKLDELGRYY